MRSSLRVVDLPLRKTVVENALIKLRFQPVWALSSGLQKTVVSVAELCVVLGLPPGGGFTAPASGQLILKGSLYLLIRTWLVGQHYAYHAFRTVLEQLFEIVRHRTEQHGFVRGCLPFGVDPSQTIVVE
jgi:hypothetical protein